MGIFDGLMGHASEIDVQKVERELAPLLCDGERVERAYNVLRDMFVFTNKRLVLIDKQGVTGKKTDFHSIPYKSITHFSVETAGTFDLDAELKIWVTGNPLPIENEFKDDKNIYDIQKMLATYVLK